MSDFDRAWSEMEKAGRVVYDANAATLAEWAKAVSAGTLTIEVPPYENRYSWGRAPVLVRVDGEPLGYDTFRDERTPITGIQLSGVDCDSVRKLTRRDRKTMVAIRNAVRTAYYGRAEADTYSALREAHGDPSHPTAKGDPMDERVEKLVWAMYGFESRNHLDGVKAS